MEILSRLGNLFHRKEPTAAAIQVESPRSDEWQPAINNEGKVIPGMWTRPIRIMSDEELFNSDFFQEVEKRDPILAALIRFLASTSPLRT